MENTRLLWCLCLRCNVLLMSMFDVNKKRIEIYIYGVRRCITKYEEYSKPQLSEL